jgi:hypothetical protein
MTPEERRIHADTLSDEYLRDGFFVGASSSLSASSSSLASLSLHRADFIKHFRPKITDKNLNGYS